MESGGSVILPVRYLAPVAWYAAAARASESAVDITARFDKRDKLTHRAAIVDANGLINLTVPIVKPQSLTGALISDIIISGHDNWWNIHLTALQSAYGRTPFFEFYEDDFKPFYTSQWEGRRLVDYTAALDALIRRLIGLPQAVAPESGWHAANQDIELPPYYQVRAGRFGFVGGLSIVDLLFNLGPEAILLLKGRM